MKANIVILIALSFLGLTNLSFGFDSKDVDFSGYMRASIGDNNFGGDQVCINNRSTQGNEFRLGNECSNYGELTMKFNHLKAKSESDKYAYSQLTFSYNPPGNEQFEDSSLKIIEGFAEIGNVFNRPISYWVGKRHYREQDIYLNDFWFFAVMSGDGAGVSGKFSNGVLKVATLRHVTSTKTDSGMYSFNITDLRYNDFKLSKDDQLNFWLALISSPKANEIGGAQRHFKEGQGEEAGVLWRRNFSHGFNHAAIQLGHGLGQSLSIYTDPVTKGDPKIAAFRKRLVEHVSVDLNKEVSLQSAAIYENVRYAGGEKNTWYSLAAGPMYKLNDDFRINSVFGYSYVNENSNSKPTLYRITLAPEVTLNESIWARPVLRFYVTYSGWNDDLKSSLATPYNNKKSETSSGFQAEVMF